MYIVSDSSPLIIFAKIGKIELLLQALGEIRIPQAVYNEIVIQGQGKPGDIELKNTVWIRKEPIKDYVKIHQLPEGLGLGEKEAILLAQEIGAILLVDDKLARREAQSRGIICVGSLRVLKEAKEKGLIAKIKPLGDELRKKGIRIKDSLYQEFIKAMGE
ncbi:MAG: DUF3368 domain-containing protein [Nitrospirae bacterium]|nr:DUF3368 domain-containing protein [Nitrospirota bacterium]